MLIESILGRLFTRQPTPAETLYHEMWADQQVRRIIACNALCEIEAMQTEHANATVKRMAARAREALDEISKPDLR